ncbi:MAG: flagellar biosynthetic protein FliR [Chlamydiota bacterium]|nr:flagellar biosynthetic protein FliR [Chlamydiota bacterium]
MTDSYVALFLNSSLATNPLGALSLFFLFLARMLPIIQSAAFLGSRVLANPVKVAFAISLFVIYLPQLFSGIATPLQFNFLLLIYMVKELFIGMILGHIISLPFIIAQSAGIFIDHQRGGSSLMVNDPTVQNQSSPLGTLFNMTLIYLFYVIGGPWDFFNAISISYELIPPDQFITSGFFSQDGLVMGQMVKLLNQIMVMATQLATPALIAILMTDSFLGIANRLAPQVQITFLGMPLKSLLGLTIVCLGWRLLTKQMVTHSHYWLDHIVEIIYMFDVYGGSRLSG